MCRKALPFRPEPPSFSARLRLASVRAGCPRSHLLDPVSDKDIRIVLLCVVAIRSEHQFLTVGRKHRKAIERIVVSNALQPRPVGFDQVEIEIAALWIG